MSISQLNNKKSYFGINVYPMHQLVGLSAQLPGCKIRICSRVSIQVPFIPWKCKHSRTSRCKILLPSSVRLVRATKQAFVLLQQKQLTIPCMIFSSKMNWMVATKDPQARITNVGTASRWSVYFNNPRPTMLHIWTRTPQLHMWDPIRWSCQRGKK